MGQERAMVSVKVQAEEGIPGLDKGWFPALEDRTLYVPVAWFNQRALATSDATSQFSDMYTALQLQVILRYVGIGCGILTFLWVLGLAALWTRKRSKSSKAQLDLCFSKRNQRLCLL